MLLKSNKSVILGILVTPPTPTPLTSPSSRYPIGYESDTVWLTETVANTSHPLHHQCTIQLFSYLINMCNTSPRHTLQVHHAAARAGAHHRAPCPRTCVAGVSV